MQFCSRYNTRRDINRVVVVSLMYTEEQIKLIVEVGPKILKKSYMPELAELIEKGNWEGVVSHLNDMIVYVCGMANAEEFLKDIDPDSLALLTEYLETPDDTK